MAKLGVEIHGLDKLRRACAKTGPHVEAAKQLHSRMAKHVIDWAAPSMPVGNGPNAGAFRRGFYGSASRVRGAQIINRVKHAGWNEFGGGVMWRPRGGKKYARVPIGGGFRMMHAHPIFLKPPPPSDSYHIYPTFFKHEKDIQILYGQEIVKFFKSFF
jgi:hypothetical protein